ncbi:MAG: beta-1,6-N-acetylglucosaminyltransferase [Dysgonamonadaceae bacterium]|jgi:hypothetical protein|nr:beta-1,6-N-acetylglucosaminyltransferase [Dysgonamonadaceae bacterium]
MTVGILILAHANFEQLRWLVNELKTDFQIYIHIDKKCAISPSLFDGEPQVHVIKKHTIYWGSQTMILATLDLMKLAYSHHCDYYMLISGSDFPLKSNKRIIEEIQQCRDTNFISYQQLPRPDWKLSGGFDRLQLYWEHLKNPRSPSLGNRLCSIFRLFQKLLGLRRKLLPLTYYGGAQWVNIAQETMQYILDYIERHPEYTDSFRHTRISDEIWLQTIVLNSPYRATTVNNDKRYIDWLTGPDFPKVLNSSDYDKIMASDAFFARKFDMKSDSEIMKRIASERRNN